MENEIAYCGGTCQTCQIFLATRESDPKNKMEHRIDIAKICNELYGTQYEAEDIGDCDGCKAENESMFSQKCKIRQCATGKSVETCAHCNEYPCEILEEFFVKEQGARERLDSIKNGL